MLHYPDVQKKAQQEEDTVVGPSRMPDFTDMESLPYVMAVIKEVARYAYHYLGIHRLTVNIRWRPVAPTGFPHALVQDDTYNGYYLPKGATVYANI